MRGIHPCRGGPSVPFTDAPPGFLPRATPRGRPAVRPSPPPPPTRRPNSRISNRESIRLETHLTQRKQSLHLRSNRERNALFDSTIHRPLLMISNRENIACSQFVTNSPEQRHVSGRPRVSAPPSSTGTPACAGPRRLHPADQDRSTCPTPPQPTPKNAHSAPLIYVAIKTNRHRLFSTTYECF
jgi:hypothetical protein